MATFKDIENWLRHGGFEVITDDKEIANYIERTSPCAQLLKVDVPNTKLSFRVHSVEGTGIIDIRSARLFGEQDQDTFSKLPHIMQEKFYRQIKEIVYPFGLNVLVFPSIYQVHFAKTIFLENLSKQYFVDTIFDFIHALDLISIVYEELSGSESVRHPMDMT
jgi:hypothetical protein